MATSHPLSPTFGFSSWERSSGRTAPLDDPGPARQGRPLLAALLMGAAGAFLVGGCVMAARLGGTPGVAAALLGFAAYLVAFCRGLDHLTIEWRAWRARNDDECLDETGGGDDPAEGRRP